MTTAVHHPERPASGFFELPFAAPEPRLTNPEVGIASVVARSGPDGAYTMDVTVLDTPDHRLVRSGVLLAHRVIGGLGEWYLAAPRWAPFLPVERVEPMGRSDLPEDMVDLVRPFRRQRTLGPWAALTCERAEFRLRDPDQAEVAVLRDDHVTIRRGGVAVARYREVSWQPVGAGLSAPARHWLEQALIAAGGTPLTRFPDLVHRLGTPAVGLTDFPAPLAPSAEDSFERYVSNLLASRLHQWVTADLAVRAGHSDGSDLLDLVAELRDEVRGLSAVFDPGWMEDLDADLVWVGSATAGADPAVATGPDAGLVRDRIRSERYLATLDRLVLATRAPALGDASQLPAGEVVASLVDTALARFVKSARRLREDSSPERWDLAVLHGRQTQNACAIARPLWRRRSRKLGKRVGRLVTALLDASPADPTALRTRAETAEPVVAFELGREYERTVARVAAARAEFVARWSERAERLTPLGERGKSTEAGRADSVADGQRAGRGVGSAEDGDVDAQ